MIRKSLISRRTLENDDEACSLKTEHESYAYMPSKEMSTE